MLPYFTYKEAYRLMATGDGQLMTKLSNLPFNLYDDAQDICYINPRTLNCMPKTLSTASLSILTTKDLNCLKNKNIRALNLRVDRHLVKALFDSINQMPTVKILRLLITRKPGSKVSGTPYNLVQCAPVLDSVEVACDGRFKLPFVAGDICQMPLQSFKERVCNGLAEQFMTQHNPSLTSIDLDWQRLSGGFDFSLFPKTCTLLRLKISTINHPLFGNLPPNLLVFGLKTCRMSPTSAPTHTVQCPPSIFVLKISSYAMPFFNRTCVKTLDKPGIASLHKLESLKIQFTGDNDLDDIMSEVPASCVHVALDNVSAHLKNRWEDPEFWPNLARLCIKYRTPFFVPRFCQLDCLTFSTLHMYGVERLQSLLLGLHDATTTLHVKIVVGANSARTVKKFFEQVLAIDHHKKGWFMLDISGAILKMYDGKVICFKMP